MLRTAIARRWMSAHPPGASLSATKPGARRKVTILDLREQHARGEAISMITAHDYPSALVADKAGLDTVLVGDSLAMVALGYESTTQITMDEMLHHCRAVARGARHAFLIGDMPFGSYQVSPADAVRNAMRFISEGRMEAIKLEGGRAVAPTVAQIVRVGVPVLGHIGLTPQTTSSLGGFRVQGKTAESVRSDLDLVRTLTTNAQAVALVNDALALQDAGCFAIVIEAVPDEISTVISHMLAVPTIGIGAGAHTGGQVLVQNDALGVFDRFVPKFCKQYVKLEAIAAESLAQFHREVKARAFPAKEHCYAIAPEQVRRFRELMVERFGGDSVKPLDELSKPLDELAKPPAAS